MFGYCIIVRRADANQTSDCRYLSLPLPLHHLPVRRLCLRLCRRKLSNIGKFRFGFRKCISIKLETIRCPMPSLRLRVSETRTTTTTKKKQEAKDGVGTLLSSSASILLCATCVFLLFMPDAYYSQCCLWWWLGLWCHNGIATWPTAVATAATQCFRYDLNRVQIKLKPKRKTFSLNENGKSLPCGWKLWRRQRQQA